MLPRREICIISSIDDTIVSIQCYCFGPDFATSSPETPALVGNIIVI